MPTDHNPQRLPKLNTVTCERCGCRVHFRVRSSMRCPTDPKCRIAYLACPICGHSATQLQEIGEVETVIRRPRTRYKYRK